MILAATSWPDVAMGLGPGLIALGWGILQLRAKRLAVQHKDAVIEGVEQANDPATKAAIKKTSFARGVELGLDEDVQRLTRRLKKRDL